MGTVRAEALISGFVQGVWFRASTRDQANRLGLDGWVRNLADGRVQAQFQGPREKVDEALAWCRQGPPRARVDRLEVTWLEPESGPTGFAVRR